jgi:hypothetical protein
MVVVGGSNQHEDDEDHDALRTCEAMYLGSGHEEDQEDEVAWPWRDFPSMKTGRDAPAVAADHNGTMYAYGGWDGSVALKTTETFNPSTSSWEAMPSMNVARCFHSGCCHQTTGRLFAIGGGDGIYQGAATFRSSEFLDLEAPDRRWRPGPAMVEQRCGQKSAISSSGLLFAVGGYGGGVKYHNTIESLDLNASSGMSSGGSSSSAGSGAGASASTSTGNTTSPWQLNLWPKMLSPRTGMGASFGPDQSLYVVGGSEDGEKFLASMERLDLRDRQVMAVDSGYCG